MIRKFKLPDNGIPIRVGDTSFIYQDVFHPIEWYGGEPYRPRVETLVLNGDGSYLFIRKNDGNRYRIPGGSIDTDSSYEKQAENEVNEEALLSVRDMQFTGVVYHQPMDKDYIAKGGDSCIPYVGAITYVYTAHRTGSIDKSTIEEKDLDDDMAKNGDFYPVVDLIQILRVDHIKALIESKRVIDPHVLSLLYKRLNDMMVNQPPATIFETGNFVGAEMETNYIYHGSTYDIDVFHPMSLDLGNADQEPGWSTFCFRDYTLAKRFALMRMIQKYLEGKNGSKYKCNWDLKKSKPYIHKSIFDEVSTGIRDQKYYVYTIDATNLELGIGNDERFPEVTFREDGIVPDQKDVLYVDEDYISFDVEVISEDPDEYEKKQMDDIENLNRGWLSCMINRDYSGDSAVAKLTKAVSDGKLKPGDDVSSYMEDNGIALKDISFIERIQQNGNSPVSESFDVSDEFEETIILGDARALHTSERKDEFDDCCERDGTNTYLPACPHPDARIIRTEFLYEIGAKGDLTFMGKFDIPLVETENRDPLYFLRLFVSPNYRRLGIGSVLFKYAVIYEHEYCSAPLHVEVHNVIWGVKGIRNWIKAKMSEIIGRTEDSVAVRLIQDKIEKTVAESANQNLSNLSWYHAEYARQDFNPKIAGGWDEELYSKTIDHAVKQAFMSAVAKDKELLKEKKLTMHMFTAGEELSAIYLGKITMYYYGLEDNGYIPKFDWEWEEQEDFTDAFLSNLREEVHPSLEGALFRPARRVKLSQFRKIDAPYDVIDEFRSCAKVLTYIEPENVGAGCIWMDKVNNNFVGVCTVEYGLLGKFNEITALEVSPRYRGYGIGRQILDYAVTVLKGNTLMVESDNVVAKYMYAEYGFKTSSASVKDVLAHKRHTYFMYLPSVLSPDKIKAADKVTIGPDPVKESVLQESVIIPRGNLEINLDKWVPGIPLWIAGTSGDGKSTLAHKLAEEYNADIISTDVLLCRLRWSKEKFEEKLKGSFGKAYKIVVSDMVMDYINRHPELPYNETGDKSVDDDDKYEPYFVDFFNWIITNAKTNPKYNKRRIIIEGCDVYFLDPTFLATQPLIILGSSELQLIRNRVKRELTKGKSFTDAIVKVLKKYKEMSLLTRKRDMLRKGVEYAMTESICSQPYDHNTEIIDLSEMTDITNDMVTEASEELSVLEPIFIVCTFTGTAFGKVVTKFQHCKFSHLGLALDSKLNKIYTFSMRKDGNGASIESIDQYSNVSTGGDGDICVMCVFVPHTVKQKVRETIEKIFANIEKTKYAFGNLFNIVIGRARDTGDSMKAVCSQFVDNVLKLANIDITGKSSNLVSPNDFANAPSRNSKVFVLFDGKRSGYKQKQIDKKVNYIRNSKKYEDISITESAIFDEFSMNTPVQENVIFNKDNVIYNIDKFESGKSNILLVTGLSGSGKSTLAEKIALEYGATIISLDNFEFCGEFPTDSDLRKYAGEVFYEYLRSRRSLWNKLKNRELNSKQLCNEIYGFTHYCINWCGRHKEQKWVIEGVQIYSFLSGDEAKRYPLIIMGTSAVTSILRRFKRNGNGNIEWGKELKNEFPNLISWYWEEEKYLKSFEKEVRMVNEFKIPEQGCFSKYAIYADLDAAREEIPQSLLEGWLSALMEAKKDETDDDLPSLGNDDKTNDYSGEAEDSVGDDDTSSDESDESESEDAGDPNELDDEMDQSDYTEDATNSEEDSEETSPEDDQSDNGDEDSGEDQGDESGDSGETDEGTDDMDDDLGGTDYTDDAGTDDSGDDLGDSSEEDSSDSDSEQKNDTQSGNNGVKNYTLLTDFESLYRLASEISDTIEPIIMEKPIQNRVLTQVRVNLSTLKTAIMNFITLYFKANDYAFNFYYYELFVGLLSKNLEILAKNKEFSSKDSQRQSNSNTKLKGGC